MSCENWQRKMFAKFREKGLSHVTCGRPWTEHGDLGECPARRPPAQRSLGGWSA